MKSLVLIALFGMLTACSRSLDELVPDCQFPTPSSKASLCVLAVSVNLGPADEVTGHDPISGLVMLVLPYSVNGLGNGSGSPDPEVLLAGNFEDLEKAATHIGRTNSEGSSLILTEPGTHIVCAVGDSLIDASRRVSQCEQVTLVSGESTPLVVSHSPWGDVLSFSWRNE